VSTDAERDQSTDRLLRAALRPRDEAGGEACLNAETLAAWADGTLYGQDAVGIEAHLADCARCQAMLAAFAQSEPAADVPAPVEAPAVVPFRPRRTMRWFVPMAVGTIAASLLIWTAVRPTTDATPQLPSMAKAETPATAPPVASTQDIATANQPRTEVAPPAKPVTALAEARPAPAPAPVPPPAVSPAASPTPSPVAAPPPPTPTPAPTGAGAVQVTSATELVRTQTRSDRSALGYLMTLPGGGVEFWPPQDTPSAAVVQIGAAGAAGAGGRGGGGGGRAAGGAAAVAQKTTPAATPASPVRWRVAASGEVSKTIDAGGTWTPVSIDPSAPITSGAAPSASVCWLVGRGGLVLLSTDGTRFTRITFPEAVDLQSVAAVDARQATVITATGRAFTTADGGATWK